MPELDGMEREERAFRAALERHADGYRPTKVNPYVPVQKRWWPTWVAVAAALVVIAGGLTALTRGLGTGGEIAASTSPGGSAASCVTDCVPTSLAPAPKGWHWVSWHDVAAQVPNSWGWGWTPSGICVDASDPRTPYVAVDSSFEPSGDVACGYPGAPTDVPTRMVQATGDVRDPALWRPLVSFSGPVPARYQGLRYVPTSGSWSYLDWQMLTVERSGVFMTVLDRAADEATLNRIKASLTSFTTDQNGCPASSPVQKQDPGRSAVTRTNVVSVSVCQYNRTIRSGRPALMGSRLLVGKRASDLVSAIEAAPAGGGPDRASECSSDARSDTAVELIAHGDTNSTQRAFYAYYDGCAGNGIADGRVLHRLTAADCVPIFAASPVIWWSGIKPVAEVCALHS